MSLAKGSGIIQFPQENTYLFVDKREAVKN